MHKQLKEELAKAMADVEKTEKGLADAKNVITSKDCEVSTLKEQVQCVLVLAHCCFFVRIALKQQLSNLLKDRDLQIKEVRKLVRN